MERPSASLGTEERVSLLSGQPEPTFPAPRARPQAMEAVGRWSLSAWAFVRRGEGPSLAGGGMIGGSQIGARLSYRLDAAAAFALSARIYSPVARPRAVEAALGLEWKPVASLPVRLLAERRQAIGNSGRSAFALAAFGGVSEVTVAGPFRLDAYAQAGVVGAKSRDLFVDGSASIALPVAGNLSLGGSARRRSAADAPGADRGKERPDFCGLAGAGGGRRRPRIGARAHRRRRFLGATLRAPSALGRKRLGSRPVDIYLPVAGLSVNALMIIALGGIVGFLSGMVGVGGGFLTTPILIFYGIPPAVAVASSTTQITGTSVSGMLAYRRRKGVDYRMGAVLVVGGTLGSVVGGGIFRLLQDTGQIDTVIGLLYVVLLGSIGFLMARESAEALNIIARRGTGKPSKRHNPLIAVLPMRWRFYQSGLYISPLAPLALGFLSGILTVLLGVGGGFIIVPAMIYLLGMSTTVVVGTSLMQILFVTAATTIIHATTTKSVDIVLAVLLLLGSVVGAQLGARFAQKAKPELLRMFLAIMVLGVAFRMALGLGWRPPEIYTIELL
jgi:hypothetical protein